MQNQSLQKVGRCKKCGREWTRRPVCCAKFWRPVAHLIKGLSHRHRIDIYLEEIPRLLIGRRNKLAAAYNPFSASCAKVCFTVVGNKTNAVNMGGRKGQWAVYFIKCLWSYSGKVRLWRQTTYSSYLIKSDPCFKALTSLLNCTTRIVLSKLMYLPMPIERYLLNRCVGFTYNRAYVMSNLLLNQWKLTS